MESLFTLARHSLAGLRALAVFTLILGLAYPLAITGVAQAAFDWRASGSLVAADGERTTSYDEAVGSTLIAQASGTPEWFHPRPSLAGEGWDAMASAGSNLGPESWTWWPPSRNVGQAWPPKRASTPPAYPSMH